MKRWYVVKTYVRASSASAAIRQARNRAPDEAVLDDRREDVTNAIGFEVDPQYDEEEDY